MKDLLEFLNVIVTEAISDPTVFNLMQVEYAARSLERYACELKEEHSEWNPES